MKLAVVYRVIQHWRVPVFNRMAAVDGVDLTILHSQDFAGTKVVNYRGDLNFRAVELKSAKLRFSTSNGRAYVPFSPGLWRALSRSKPDVIICEGASNLINNVMCFAYSLVHSVPLIQWGLGEIQGRKRSLHRRFADLVFRSIERRSAGAIAYSKFGADYYRRIGIPADRVFVAVNVVDTDGRAAAMVRYCTESSLTFPSPLPPTFNILFVGALAENKGVDNLLRAFAAFQTRQPACEARLTIVGDGPYRSHLRALAVELGIERSLTMPGQVTDGIASYFYDASLFVLPGLGGLAVSDALVHGVPVVATVGDGSEKDLIEDGVNGYYVRDLTVETLAAILTDLSQRPEKLVALRQGAQRFNSGPHNIENYVRSIVKAAETVVNGR